MQDMEPQVDTAQRRAELLLHKLAGWEPNLTATDVASDIQRIADALQQARREALEEAAKVVRDRALLWKSHGGAKMASPYGHLTVEGECEVIANAIDRLREGR